MTLQGCLFTIRPVFPAMKSVYGVCLLILFWGMTVPAVSHGQAGLIHPALKRLMIDPGHGGPDRGVEGPSGWPEGQLTLSLAKQLKAVLEARWDVKVFLTREEGQHPTLLERTIKANALKADLFISLHARGSLSESVKGFKVYYQDYGRQADLAEAAARLDQSEGAEPEWRLNQAAWLSASTALAREIDRALQDVLHLKSDGPTGLPLALLAGARQPAVLVEVGALTNPEEERRLKTQGYKDALTRALILGIESWARQMEQ